MPEFSIVMSAFQPWCPIGHALGCVISQTFEDWELLVVPDGEPDEFTVTQVTRLIQKWKYRIRLLSSSRREGCWGNPARNTGTHEAEGRYICWVNHDNLIFPDYLKRHMGNFSAMKDGSGISVVPIELSSRGKFLGRYPKQRIKLGGIDLLNFAMPTKFAQEIDAFGEKHAETYEADWLLFQRASQSLPVRIDECQTPAGIHF
jgi:glycosyltransferase involved in cell wall biosynthesis